MKVSITLWVTTALLAVPRLAIAFQGTWPTDGVIVQQRQVPEMQAVPAGVGTLSGRAVVRETNTPLPGARVVVRLLGAPVGQFGLASTPFGRVLTTDKNGEFVIPQTSLGNYFVEVEMAGYADATGFIMGGSRRTMQLTEAQPSATETFPLSRLGTLEGTVVDEKGQPLADQAVQLFRRDRGLGSMTLPEPPKAITDSAGRYRFTSVPPAEYIVGVDFRSTTMPLSVSETYRRALQTLDGDRMASRLEDSYAPVPRPLPPNLNLTIGEFQFSVEDTARRLRPVEVSATGTITGVATTYAPGVTSFAEARTYSLTSGQNLTGIDIKVRRQPTVRVSGRLTGPEGTTSHVGLRLVPKGVDNIDRASFGDAARTVTDAQGQFTFLGVLPGQYTLEGFVLVYPPGGQLRPGTSIPVGPDGFALRKQVQSWAKLSVEVSTEDVAGLSLPLSAPFFVTGRVVCVIVDESGPPKPALGVKVYLSRRTGQQASSPSTTTPEDGTFSLGPAFPDKYELSAPVGAPWRVVSIVANGRDITNQVIELDRSITNVVITLTNAIR